MDERDYKAMNEGLVVNVPKYYAINTDNIQSLNDIKLILNALNYLITDSNKHYEELKSKGLI
jgi:hypothetical protein